MEIFNFVFNNILTIVWNSIWFWRITFSVLMLFFIILVKYKYLLLFREKFVNNEKKIFEEMDSFFSEFILFGLLNKLEYRVIYVKEITFLTKYLDFTNEEGNQFLFKSIRKASLDLKKSVEDLVYFIQSHFMYHNQRENDERLHFEPDLKYSDRRKEYDKLYDDLVNKIGNVGEFYKTYRKEIKKRIFI